MTNLPLIDHLKDKLADELTCSTGTREQALCYQSMIQDLEIEALKDRVLYLECMLEETMKYLKNKEEK